MPDGTYAPQSPDLSSFLSSSTPSKKAQTSSYTPRSPNLCAFNSNSLYPSQQQQHQQQQQQPLGLGLGLGHAEQPIPQSQSHPRQPYHPHSHSYSSPQDPFSLAQPYHKYQPPIPDLPPSHSFPPQLQQQQQQRQHQIQTAPYPPLHQPQTRSVLKPEPTSPNAVDYPIVQGLPVDMSGRSKRQPAVKVENNGGGSALGPSQGIEVKTKFPVARIKRIMQADEEVGKVAQVTPVAVSKALELFMISLVTKSADVAKEANSKRVTAQHLKKAIAADEQFDFLNDIVSRVADGPDAGGKRVKDDDDSDEDDKKAVKKTKGRRKKGD